MWQCGSIPTLPLSTAPCPPPCHILGPQLHSPTVAAWPLAVLLGRRSQAALRGAVLWEQEHTARPPKGREGKGWQQARDGSGDVRTSGKGSQTPREKTGAQQRRAQHNSSVPHAPWCGCTAPGRAWCCPHAMAPLPGCPHGRGHGHAAAHPQAPAGHRGRSVPSPAAGPRRGAARASLTPAPPGNESGLVSFRARGGSKGVRKLPRQPFPCTSKRPPPGLYQHPFCASAGRGRIGPAGHSPGPGTGAAPCPRSSRGCCGGVPLLLSGCFAP